MLIFIQECHTFQYSTINGHEPTQSCQQLYNNKSKCKEFFELTDERKVFIFLLIQHVIQHIVMFFSMHPLRNKL